MTALERWDRRLVRIYAVALDLPADYFDPMFAQPNMIQRFTHYPPQPFYEDNQFSIAPHTDSGFMTLLAPSAVPGLSIRLPDGTWFDAPSDPEAFIVNGGDILRRWTNDRFLSTPHRAINKSGRARYAIPFFFDTHPDTLIELPADLPVTRQPAEVRTDHLRRVCAVVRHAELRASRSGASCSLIPGHVPVNSRFRSDGLRFHPTRREFHGKLRRYVWVQWPVCTSARDNRGVRQNCRSIAVRSPNR